MHGFQFRAMLLGVLASALSLAGMSRAAAAVSSAAPAPLPVEHVSVAKLPPKTPHWVYVLDEAQLNEIDARVYLFDGDSYRRLGQLGAGFMPGIALSPDGRTTVVATTYFARGGHGRRSDVVEFNDNATLATSGEIVIPPKHAQTLAMMFDVAYSADGRFVYVPYLTPAASFGVLDPIKKRVLSEIDTAGCVLVFPSGPNRVSSLCESGRLLTVSLNPQGHEASRASSEPFFDPDRDPLFAQAIPSADGFTFLSFLGEVHEVSFTAARPQFRPPWSLVSNAEKGTWRPGGIQIGAIHRTLGRLFVPMHQGDESAHKQGGSEIWVFDLNTHRRIARWPCDVPGSGPVVAVQVSQDPAPLLFAATDHDLEIYDARTGQLKHVEKQLGQTPSLILNP